MRNTKLFRDFESAAGKGKFQRNINKASKAMIARVKTEKLAPDANESGLCTWFAVLLIYTDG